MLLKLDGIKKYYPDRSQGLVKAVDGVSLGIARGEHCAIVGESGCGKTTLARIVMGLVRPDEGKMLFAGNPVWGDRNREVYFRRRARMVFQDPFSSLDPRYSVKSILNEALYLEGKLSPQERHQRMCAVLAAVSLPENILSRYPHEFSGGERQRIAIGRALMTDPEFLILDEAVSSLDVLIQKEVLDCLDSLQRDRDLTYLFITHNIKAAQRLRCRIISMKEGKIHSNPGIGNL